MDLNPMESTAGADDSTAASRDRATARLTTHVAITVALLATFLGVCKVKDDNIVQAMQQAQADKIDHWGFYQARNLREELARATAVQLRLQSDGQPAARQPAYQEAIGRYVHDLQTKPVDAKELNRIKSHQRYAFELGLDTPGNVAAQAAEAIAVAGDIDALNQRFATYQKVTPADIQRVAAKFFQPQNETVVTLSHKAAAAAAPGTQGGAHHD